jgi:tRNA A-37 threonylcarbamoyl transferase component Bud32
MSEGSIVERLHQEIADRQPIDWSALLAELQADGPASPETLKEVSLLQLLDEIGQANFTLQSGVYDTEEPARAPADALADDTLEAWGRYILEGKVGRGGFGSVYQARDPMLDMSVAIKILHRRYSDARLKQRLIEEGQALAKVRHVNVVRVLTVEQHDDRLGLVMELLSGETMDAIVSANGPLDHADAAAVVEDVCRALVAVHANGLIHRDVKARNIIREATGRIVLMDFGAGLPVRDAKEQGTTVGTPLYMAPEALKGAPVTPAGDVYAVGVLLFYLVTGRYPYEGGSLDEIRDAHAARRGNNLLALRPGLPARFVRIVERAIALDPEVRFHTPDALLEALLDSRAAAEAGVWWLKPTLIAVGALLAVIVVGGMLSSVAFDTVLGRGAYQNDTFLAKVGYGAQALFLPVLLACLAAVLTGALAAVRRVAVSSSARARDLDSRGIGWCRAMARRLSLQDSTVCASWLLLVTAVCTGLIWAIWAPILQVVTTHISTAPPEMLAVLSPELAPYRTGYRMSLSLVIAGNIAGWIALRRRAPRNPPPIWMRVTEVALMVLLLFSMQLPYRILHHIETKDAVIWNGQQCYVLGKAPNEDHLMYCSRMMPRIFVMPRPGTPLPRPSKKEHPFAPFSPGQR